MKEIDLDSLVGLHDLTGCDMMVQQIERYGVTEECNVIRFTLDGITYTAVENPSDGYRSSMEHIFAEQAKLVNRFEPVKVLVTKKPNDHYGNQNEALDLIDVVTGKVVLEVGTLNSDDYYPSFVYSFHPENMAINVSVHATR